MISKLVKGESWLEAYATTNKPCLAMKKNTHSRIIAGRKAPHAIVISSILHVQRHLLIANSHVQA